MNRQPVEHRSERALWSDFRQGNQEAFSDLYRIAYPRLYAYGLSCGMDREVVSDAIQDLFLRLFNRPALIRNAETLRPFMLKAIKNFGLNQIKRTHRHDRLEEGQVFEFSYTIEESIIHHEKSNLTRERVRRLIDSLSPRQKEIVYLRFYLELDYTEIEQVMNLSHQTARNLLYKAIQNLRKADPDNFRLFLGLLSLAAFSDFQ